MKFVLYKKERDVQYLNKDSGYFETSVLEAGIEYEIDSDNDLRITINTQFFKQQDIDDLIEFLKAIKPFVSKEKE